MKTVYTLYFIRDKNKKEFYAWSDDKTVIKKFLSIRNKKKFKRVREDMDDYEFKKFREEFSDKRIVPDILHNYVGDISVFITIEEKDVIDQASEEIYDILQTATHILENEHMYGYDDFSVDTAIIYLKKDVKEMLLELLRLCHSSVKGGCVFHLDVAKLFVKYFGETLKQ